MHLNLENLNSLAEVVALSLKLRVYHLELVGSGHNKILRVFIDRPDKEKVTLQDCSDFSKAISEKLDESDPIDGAYSLEVSSPGVERVLAQAWHYLESIGESVYVQLKQPLSAGGENQSPLGNRKKLTGVLKAVQDEKLSIDFENMNVTVPLQNVSKAHVVFDFGKKMTKE